MRDTAGNLYIADSINYRVRKVAAATGVITTIAGNGTFGSGGDDGVATAAQLNQPYAVALDAAGNIYIADRGANKIRKVTLATGYISTIAGSGTAGYLGDGTPATTARLNDPTGVAVDSSGNVLIADYANHRIRKVASSNGVITTIAGNGSAGSLGEGGPAISARLYFPAGVALDAAGNVYIADMTNARIRKVTVATGMLNTVAGSGNAMFGGDGSGPAGQLQPHRRRRGRSREPHGDCFNHRFAGSPATGDSGRAHRNAFSAIAFA